MVNTNGLLFSSDQRGVPALEIDYRLRLEEMKWGNVGKEERTKQGHRGKLGVSYDDYTTRVNERERNTEGQLIPR